MSDGDERRRLTELYRTMAEGELLRLAEESTELTETAAQVVREELARRGVGAAAAVAPPAVSHEVMEDRALVQVGRFRDLPEALLAKGSLESAGIECFLYNDNMVRMDWFWSNMIGGATLHVDAENESVAKEILAAEPADFQPDTDGE